MKPHLFPIVFALAATAVLSGCSDPSDGVHKSSTADPETASAASMAGRQYVIQPESKITFVGSKVTGQHDGGFTNFTGTINVAGGKIGSSEIKIHMDSTWSDNNRLTRHLLSADFFDAQAFPVSTFTVTRVEPAGAQHTVTGNLDLHGVTKSISFPADIQVSDDSVTVKAEFAINRREFNINYPGQPNDLIRDNVVMKLDVKAAPGS